ncbi:hypothetical protein H5410_048365 [Solanum commersonii]|uniref:P-type Ca(2+) transporter n=1 Tax=Solanum commersonii TaxID=4109 RepID=A0A9J5XHY5_SOLCO|nr:hypothetical protein H5410_048365 [Solanum commersonii]
MCDNILLVQLPPILTSPARKRWRWAYKILYTARALLSTARKIVAENKTDILSNFSRSRSYTAVDIEPECFSNISKQMLAKLVRVRDVKQFDGVESVLFLLKADADKGILGDVKDIASRRKHFGTNTFKKPSVNLLQILLKSLKDPNIIIVLLYAVLSLGFGVKKHGVKGCLDGGIIVIALFLAIGLSALCNYWHKQQFYELCRPIETVPILVIRDGKDTRIALSEAVVGDVIRLKAGDQVPADGICIGDQTLHIDESTITRKNELVEVNSSTNMFLLSGSKVLRGHGRMLVTAVGMDTALAEIISPACVNHDHKSLLQKKLHKLTSCIAKVGWAVSFLVFLVLLVRYFTGNMRNNGRKLFIGGKTSIQDVWKAFLGILATPVAIASGAIPEGLTLACALTIAYSTKKIIADQALVRSLSACEAIASATVICTNKEGVLTENSLQARKAVMDCQDAGVSIKIITKDDIHTARASAIDCGIIDPHNTSTGEVIEGTTFQEYTEDERLEKVDNIRVIARASTLDKLLMVRCLQKKGHVVAVTGDRVEDAEALREANVGLSLGNQGTDAARNSSDNVIMDDNFASIARVLSWGRTTYNNVQIFTQYQLTATIASLVIDFVTAISANEPVTINIVTVISAGNVPYAMLQVLWVKLMVGTLAAVALTIDEPGTKVMQQPPTNQNEPFITNIMWKNILGQALYLISVLLTIQFTGESEYQLSDKEKDTMIFNIFVLCQLSNIFHLRKYEGNLLRELKTKRLFWGIVGMIVVIQFAMIELLKKFACTERLNWQQWQVCIGIAALSWPVSLLIKCIPVPKTPLFSSWNGQNFSYSRFRSSVRL